jgi:hypothetical protein
MYMCAPPRVGVLAIGVELLARASFQRVER